MVFGTKTGGGLSGLKSAVRDEGAISEKMRLQHIKEQRDKEELSRAKTSIQEKKHTLERNKLEISHKETEIRRLAAEITRAQGLVTEMENDMKTFDSRMSVLKTSHNDMLFKIENHKRETDKQRTEITKEQQEIKRYEQEIRAIEVKMSHEKDTIRSIDMKIEKFLVEMAHLINDANKVQVEVSHAHSNRMYKEKELDARKRSFNILSEKRTRGISEVQRLHGENSRLEQEIKTLEQAKIASQSVHARAF